MSGKETDIMQSRKNVARDLVWRAFIAHARNNVDLERTLSNGIGIFRFMDVVDLVVDELLAYQDSQTDLPALVERLRAENVDLRDKLKAINGLSAAGAASSVDDDLDLVRVGSVADKENPNGQ